MSNGYVETPTRSFQAGAALARSRRVKLSAGKLALAGAQDAELGVLDEAALAADEYVPVRLRHAPGTMKMIASGAITAFARVYGTASGKITATPGGVFQGIAMEAATADGDAIEVLRVWDPVNLVASQEAAGTALTATNVETSLGSATIDGAGLRVGDVLRVLAQVVATATNSTDTLTLKLYAGTEQIVTTGAVDVANGDIGFIMVEIVVRAIGASGKIVAAGIQALGVPGTVTGKPFFLAEATEDISGNFAIDLKGTWSSTNAGNSCRCDIFNVSILRK